jgi:antitoxin component YwqK of YwqJK toxin-antitoxin module
VDRSETEGRCPIERIMLDDAEYDNSDRLIYRGEPFTGIAVEVDSDGVLEAESTYRSGVQDGVDRAYRRDGTIKAEDIYRYGIMVESREWHPTGQLAYESHNDRSGRNLSRQRWNEDGSPQP